MNYCKKLYYGSGEIQSETWYHNNKLHRDDGPARVAYLPSGEIHSENWYLNNKLHRTDGPAVVHYNKSGKIIAKCWWINGSSIYPNEWLKENNYTWPLNKNQQTELILTIV